MLNYMASSNLYEKRFRLLNMTTLSERIQEIIEAGYTQAQLHRAAKVTKGTSNQWLNGKIKSIKLEYAQGIEALTNFRAAWIVTGKGAKIREAAPDHVVQQIRAEYDPCIGEKQTAFGDDVSSAELIELLTLYRRLPLEQRRNFLNSMRNAQNAISGKGE